ncbi:4Fe-4S double cluster binding domain-containing protein [Thermodesulfobacteriota bacterium]
MQKEIQEIVKGCGIDLFGIADLSPALAQLVGQGGAIFQKYPRAVSLGCRLAGEVVDAIEDHGNRALVMNYIHHIYSVVNQRLDQAALSVAGLLMQRGYLAFPVPASQVLSYETYTGLAPHKTAAHLSGLGWIGRSALLITREYGPRVRFATVCTDAPLSAGTPVKNRCGSCRLCVDACPAGAITGETFSEEMPRDHIYDAKICNAYMKERRLSLLGKHVFGGNCGLCVQSCHFGKPKPKALNAT